MYARNITDLVPQAWLLSAKPAANIRRICFIAYKVYKELERLIEINKIGMSVDHVLDVAKTITTIKIRMPENGASFTKTLFLTDKHRTIMSLFDLSKDQF